MARRTRQQREGAASGTAIVSYTNRFGDTYYLHQGRTKTGKVRYFAAKTLREGALSTMPENFEFSESINGVVSMRRIDPSAASIAEVDVGLARTEMARHPHLQYYRIEAVKDEIVVFEPIGGTPPDWGMVFALGSLRRRVRYDPVMKFVSHPERRTYSVHRMTYRGNGGWSWPLASGSLHELLRRFLACVGTDEFFELL